MCGAGRPWVHPAEAARCFAISICHRFDQHNSLAGARADAHLCSAGNCRGAGTMGLHLVTGNKNYSSWSMRPWIAMKVANIAFDETVIPIYHPGSREKFLAHSPAGKVPILHDDEVRVWESLAILEYLAEKFPQAGFWPADPAARAHARAIASEMHAGLVPLRRHLPMNIWRPV